MHRTDRMLFEETGVIGWGGNSGFHAINLAAQFGAAKIIMVGIDMTLDHGEHWFGKHPYGRGPKQANVIRWRGRLDASAPLLRERGIRVINCSSISTLTAFEKMEFERALEC